MPLKTRAGFILIVAFTFFLSCSKSKDGGSAIDPCDRIAEVLDYHPYETPQYQSTAIFSYDELGRVTSVKGPGQNKANYVYHKDKIVLTATNIFGDDISAIYYLDNAGRIKRTDFADEAYTYDSEGYLISFKSYYVYNGQIMGFNPYFLKWENGNLAEVYTTAQNVSNQQIAFEYFDSPNQEMAGYNSPFYIGQVLGDRNSFFLVQAGFYGKQSKNLMKASIFNGAGYGANTYHYDTKNRIIGIGEWYKFIYNCP